MGGSHREAAEAVVLGREPERTRGLRWRESARQKHRQWRRGGSSSSGAVERRTVKRGSGWRPTAFEAEAG
jgi:hypothetical protein